MHIELDENERNNLMILLDVAIKAGGMQAAKAAMPIIEKLENPPPVDVTQEHVDGKV